MLFELHENLESNIFGSMLFVLFNRCKKKKIATGNGKLGVWQMSLVELTVSLLLVQQRARKRVSLSENLYLATSKRNKSIPEDGNISVTT